MNKALPVIPRDKNLKATSEWASDKGVPEGRHLTEMGLVRLRNRTEVQSLLVRDETLAASLS